jgi:hypothetical protein
MPAVTSPDVQVGNQVIPSARQRFEQATRLGYLKCDFPLGRLAATWRDYCEEQQIPFIAMAPRGQSWEITYAVPADDPFVLRQRFLGVGLFDSIGSGSRFETRRAMVPAGRSSRPAA